MKIGVIGAGAWGKNLVRTLAELGALHAVADAVPQNRENAALVAPEAVLFEDYRPLLSSGVQAVVIATPAHTHFAIAIAALDAGLDVFVEKPLTLDVDEAEKLCCYAQEKNRILMVGHLLLYKPAVEFIRNYLRDGHLGKVYTLHQERMKLGKARAVENALWSLGVHDVAALLYIVGEAPVDTMFSGHAALNEGIEDDAYLHMTFANGCKAHLHNSWLWPEDRRGLRVIGEKGMLVYDEKAETVTLVRKTIDSQLNNVDQGSEVLFEAPANLQALTAEMQHFMKCITTRDTPRSCGKNGLDVVRVLAGIDS
jgi:predicted dehydrogenase